MNYPHVFDDKYTFAHFMQHQHARRMICALVHFLPPDEWVSQEAFSEFLADPENKRFILPLIKDAFSPVKAYRETLENTASASDSEDRKTLMLLAGEHNKNETINGLDFVDLASPVIKEADIRRLFCLIDTSPQSRLALSLNANCPPDLVFGQSDARLLNRVHQLVITGRVAARYGDLEDPSTISAIDEAFGVRSMRSAETMQITEMLTRKSFDKLAVSIMDKYADSKEYALLSKLPEHQEYLREKYKNEMIPLEDVVTRAGSINLPPTMTGANLDNLLIEAKAKGTPVHARLDHALLRARVALHPNAECTRIIEAMKRKKDKEYIGSMIADSDAPAACWIIRAATLLPSAGGAPAIGKVKGAAQDDLLWAAENLAQKTTPDDRARILCHPNFPWNTADQDKILASTNIGIVDVVFAARHLHRHITGEAFPEHRMAGFPGATLFSPSISAIRLEKLVAEHPEMAPLAACHPNGGDIVVEDKKHRAIVERFRNKFLAPSLAGKSAVASKSRTHSTLEL